MYAAGGSYQCLRDTFYIQGIETAENQGSSPYELMDRLAEQAKLGTNGLLFFSYRLGERSP
jgi:xylulokinase